MRDKFTYKDKFERDGMVFSYQLNFDDYWPRSTDKANYMSIEVLTRQGVKVDLLKHLIRPINLEGYEGVGFKGIVPKGRGVTSDRSYCVRLKLLGSKGGGNLLSPLFVWQLRIDFGATTIIKHIPMLANFDYIRRKPEAMAGAVGFLGMGTVGLVGYKALTSTKGSNRSRSRKR